jgi:cytidine deaminase
LSPRKLPLARLRKRLIAAARQAQRNAHCPFSHYPVGAAVLGASGRVFTGCNVESPTLIANICAERNAIYQAIARGEKGIIAVCVVSRASEPCGFCRQVIREFGIDDVPIYAIHRDPLTGREKLLETTIGRLLPRAHTAEFLQTPDKERPHGPQEHR